jgi:hypothetical protein
MLINRPEIATFAGKWNKVDLLTWGYSVYQNMVVRVDGEKERQKEIWEHAM